MSPKREQMTDDKWCPSTAGPAATSVNLKWKWKHQPKANGHKRADNYFQEDLEDTFCRPFICCICSQRVTALVSQIQITLWPAGLSCLIPLHLSWHPIWNCSLEPNATAVGAAKFNQGRPVMLHRPLLDSGLQLSSFNCSWSTSQVLHHPWQEHSCWTI